MHRALIIAHPFPPAGGGGVQRSAKLVKYLPSFGWRATVLTTHAELYPELMGVEDRALLAEVESEAEIVRVYSPEAIALPKGMDRWLKRLAPPDKSVLWNPGALTRAVALHVMNPFEIIYATANPYSSFLLARELARLIRRPYVLDMRDAWRLRGNRKEGHALTELRLARLERISLEGARHVIFATKPMEERYLENYPFLRGNSSTVINGFDERDYPSAANPSPLKGAADPVIFFYSGTWNDYVKPDLLLKAFQDARAQDSDFRARARLEMIGRTLSSIDGLIDRHGLREIYAHRGYKSHPETVLLQRTADVLLLVTSGLPDEQQAKTAEYLAAGRPVVALVDEGVPAEKLIRHATHLETARPDDVVGATRALLAAFHAANERRVGPVLPVPAPALEPFTRRAAAHAVAAIFER